MENIKCKLCNRVLTNPESIKLGYGKKCYRVFQLQQSALQEANELIEMKQKWSQLSLKCSVLERKLNNILASGIQTNNPIERVKRPEKFVSTEEDRLKVLIHQELKSIFTNKEGNFDPNWKAKILHSVDEIREPPIYYDMDDKPVNVEITI